MAEEINVELDGNESEERYIQRVLSQMRSDIDRRFLEACFGPKNVNGADKTVNRTTLPGLACPSHPSDAPR